MKNYDIKHPLRGEEYEECPQFKQEFADKIQHIASDPQSFMKYKRSQRQTLDKSALQSEEFLKKEQEEFLK